MGLQIGTRSHLVTLLAAQVSVGKTFDSKQGFSEFWNNISDMEEWLCRSHCKSWNTGPRQLLHDRYLNMTEYS